MRAIWITKYGGPEVLELRETPDPEPKAGEVKVRTAACGLNFAEVTARKGLYPDAPKPPCVVGYEGAGTIEAVGPGVDPGRIGQRVLYLSVFGGQADVVVTNERRVFELPAGMSFEHAAALPVNYLTAYHMLFQLARVRSGDSVLIHMAAGGVGTAVLQLCRSVEGLTTYGTASASKHDYVRAHGCDHPIDYHATDYAKEVLRLTQGRGVSLVLDALGGPDWRRGYELLHPAGMLIAFGLANVSTGPKRNLLHAAGQVLRSPRFSPMKLMGDNRTVAGCNMGHMFGEVELLSGHMRKLLDLYGQGRIEPQVSATFPFERAGEAYRELESRRNRGKVLLIPPPR
jgi:NADPH:quinone reductase-like Zn-dependent oxidoreductase